MEREGSPKPLVFDLIRDEIPRPSVDLAEMIRPSIGYIHVTQFMETTSREVGDALDKFGNIHGLVIDLRGNPGGLLNEAVSMSDKFLQKGQIVVSQKGRAFPDQVYRAAHGSDTKYPIVVLVNRNTASAAEIVSGALQDHDRALIVGETTFGKGLVQTVFQVSEDTGLALTTYHYYTPSGRLIQRNYSNISLYDYYYVRDGVEKGANREVNHSRRKDRDAQVQSLPERSAPALCLLQLQQALPRHAHRRQGLPSGRCCADAVQGFSEVEERHLHGRRSERRNGLGQGQHQERTVYLAVRSA
jgi:C-terminal processing protease CtpA/Prc